MQVSPMTWKNTKSSIHPLVAVHRCHFPMKLTFALLLSETCICSSGHHLNTLFVAPSLIKTEWKTSSKLDEKQWTCSRIGRWNKLLARTIQHCRPRLKGFWTFGRYCSPSKDFSRTRSITPKNEFRCWCWYVHAIKLNDILWKHWGQTEPLKKRVRLMTVMFLTLFACPYVFVFYALIPYILSKISPEHGFLLWFYNPPMTVSRKIILPAQVFYVENKS